MTQNVALASDKYKTCLITIVQPGQSDSVIKVFPAEHEKEKIWLDNARGIERMEVVQRLLDNFAERGTRVPKPAPYHSSSKDLRSVDLKPEDIPLVRLDGAILTAPPEEDKIDYSKLNQNPAIENAKKIADLERVVSALASSISNLAALVSAKPASSEQAKASCEHCGKEVKNSHALTIHKGKYHKGGK